MALRRWCEWRRLRDEPRVRDALRLLAVARKAWRPVRWLVFDVAMVRRAL